MAEGVRVNFGRPIPLFPLPHAVLLPHSVQPLHIFEPRYRQMIEDCLDSAGQIAMATFEGVAWKQSYEGTPPIRPSVCIGQIVQHEALAGGRHNILLHGVCRARIVELLEPDDDHLYRRAMLRQHEVKHDDADKLQLVREGLVRLLSTPRLKRMSGVDTVMQWVRSDEITTVALLELIGFVLIHDHDLKYRLLDEACPLRRAALIRSELSHLDALVRQADRQKPSAWPKGMSWN